MATFSYDEAIYGALCYIYGDDDNTLSVDEKINIKSRFNERHYLSDEAFRIISFRWSQGAEDFYWDVINSLNEYSLIQRLEALKTICIIINDYSSQRPERWYPFHKILHDIGTTIDEYNRYIR